MESGLLPNSAITASSVYRASTNRSWLARLNNVPNGEFWGAWVAASNEAGQWLQIDLGEERLLTNFATQGRPSSPQWVTSYTILFSSDSVKWEEYKENGVVKVRDAFFFKRNLTRNSTRDIASFLWSFRDRARLLVCSFYWCNVFEFYCYIYNYYLE